MVNRKQVVCWLAVTGVVIHVAFLLLHGTVAQIHADKVRERMRADPEYDPGYEGWEAGWIAAEMILGLPCCIYLPAMLVAVTITMISYHPEPKAMLFKVFGIVLGSLTVLYALLWTFV